MSIFKLPDLGEGLPDAEISQWHVKVGDTVAIDQPIVAMETAKAVVDVPAPQPGVIKTLFGKAGDIIKTGAPLVEFVSDEKAATTDSGTVVGSIESSGKTIKELFTIGPASDAARSTIKATPATRALAKQLNVDLNKIRASNPSGVISSDDVQMAAKMSQTIGDVEPLRGARRMMAINMAQSHTSVVPVMLCDDADIHHWQNNSDISVNLIKAIVAACAAVPALNTWFDDINIGVRKHHEVHLGLAIDTGDELLVPVIKNAEKLEPEQLRERINHYKEQARSRSIAKEDFHGATITLSNFGNFAGRYASPIIVPPQVAIIAVGRSRDSVVANNGNAVIHKVMPVSLTFDHRCVTGGEASRFLAAVIQNIEKQQ